jgi:hypothetical protein
MMSSQPLVNPACVKQLSAFFSLYIRDHVTDEQCMRSSRPKIEDLDFPNAQCSCRNGQRIFSRSGNFEWQRVAVNFNLLMVSAELIGNLDISGGNTGKRNLAPVLDGFHGGAAVAKRESESVRCDWTYEVHRKYVAVLAVVHADEENGPWAYVENQRLLNGARTQREAVRARVLGGRPPVHPAIPRSPRPGRATVCAAAHLEQPQQCFSGIPKLGLAKTQCSNQLTAVPVNELQFRLGRTFNRRSHLRVQPYRNRQRLERGHHIVGGHVKVMSRSDETDLDALLRRQQGNRLPLNRGIKSFFERYRKPHGIIRDWSPGEYTIGAKRFTRWP